MKNKKIIVLTMLIFTGWIFSAKGQIFGTTGPLTWELRLSDSTLTISGSGAMPNYDTSSLAPWSSYKNQIKFVLIENEVTSIGNLAFWSCSNITSITIPNSITSIGNNAFSGCSGLTSVTIPNSVISIGRSAFSDCSSLNSVIIPNSVTSIGSSAFSSCSGLTSVIIPNSVTSIGSSAFSGCSGLTSVIISNGVTSIGIYAFLGCSALTSVTIPNSVATIGSGAFYNCSSLTFINVDEDNTAYSSDNDGVMYDKSKTVLLQYPIGRTDINYEISNNVITIGEYAFFNCDNLTSVTIPNSVTTIEGSAFRSCDNLTSVTIPESVINVGSSAFGSCSNLQVVNYNAINCLTMGTASNTVFFSCSSLHTLNIGDAVESIPAVAFYRSSLTSVTIPDNIINIGDSAFARCSNLTSAIINGTNIGNNAFADCSNLSSTTLGDKVASIGNSAFHNCTGLVSIIMGNGLKSIGNNAFAECSSLTSITIPDSVTNIGFSAFSQCASIHTVNYNAINCSVILALFSGNTAFSTLNIGNKVESIPDRIFGGSWNLTSVIIPNSVKTIGNSAFSNCRGLTSVTIPNSVTDIGNSAFSATRNLTDIIIGNSVVNIGNYAFATYYASSITSITSITSYAITPPNLGTEVFFYTPDPNLDTFLNIPIYIPCHTYPDYSTAPGWSDFTHFIYGTPTEDTTFYNAVKCYDRPYTDNNFTTPIHSAGTYYATIMNSGRCDSTVCMTLVESMPIPVTNYSANACHGTSYTDEHFANLTEEGNYYDTLQNVNGCDSIICVNLSYYPEIPITNYSANACHGTSYSDEHFANLTQAGNYYDTLQNVNGCDSIFCLSLSYYPEIPVTNYSASICHGTSYSDDHFTNLTEAGIYYDTLQNVNGCDSVVCLSLSYYPEVPITEYSASICQDASYTDDHFTDLIQAGIYYDTLQNVNGCDSIFVLSLTVKPLIGEMGSIHGETVISQGNTYSYSIDAVEHATHYEWHISNEDWLIQGSGNNILLNIQSSGQGTLSVSAINDCSTEVSTLVIESTVGVQDYDTHSEIQLYPNPTFGEIELKIANPDLKIEEVYIYDIYGKLLKTVNVAHSVNKISLSEFANGAYLLHIVGKDTNIGIFKVIKF